MTHDEMIAVIEHHKKGGTVEVRSRGGPGGWCVASVPTWDFSRFEYRPKKAPVERWAVEWDSGIITYYLSKKSAEEDFKEWTGTVRMFKMVEETTD